MKHYYFRSMVLFLGLMINLTELGTEARAESRPAEFTSNSNVIAEALVSRQEPFGSCDYDLIKSFVTRVRSEGEAPLPVYMKNTNLSFLQGLCLAYK